MSGFLDHPIISEFDEAADAQLDRLRGNATADRVFYAASEAANHSLLWVGLAWVFGIWTKAGRRRAIKTSIALAVESAAVNGPIKKVFARERPEHEGERPHKLRQPRSSSFPSGHATSGFMAAAVLGHKRKTKPLFYALAVIVATSRAYVKIHHASDVVGGVIVGIFGGKLAKRIIFGSARKTS